MLSLHDNIVFIAGPEKDGWECIADDVRIAKTGWDKSHVRFAGVGDGAIDLSIKEIAFDASKYPSPSVKQRANEINDKKKLQP